MKAATILLLGLLLPLTAAAVPSTGTPVAYLSEDVYGYSRGAVIGPKNDQQLFLFIDYDNAPDVGASSMTATMCVDEDGDETCAFDVWLQMTTDGATFDSFTPADPQSFVYRLEPTSLRVNGIGRNANGQVAGMAIPAPIGRLTVDALGANELQISVLGVHRVGAAGQLDPIQPGVVARVETVPEPDEVLLLASALVALAALHHLRRRWRRAVA